MNQSEQLCGREISCLIIIDMQERLTNAMPPKIITRIENNTHILLTAANKLQIPVIATAQYPTGLGNIKPFIADNLLDSAAYFDKTCFSCFGADGFKNHLESLKKTQVILVGIEAHICVLQSAFRLMAAGYQVFIVGDAIASRQSYHYKTAIMRLNEAGGRITNTESVLFEWLADAAHADFKSLSKLIV